MSLGSGSALNSLIHPKLHGSLDRAYPAYVTVQVAAEEQGDDFAIDEVWTDWLRGLRGILAAAKAEEHDHANVTNVKTTHVLDLQTYEPEITVTHRIIVSRTAEGNGRIYNITGAKHDSQGCSSRLELEEVSH